MTQDVACYVRSVAVRRYNLSDDDGHKGQLLQGCFCDTTYFGDLMAVVVMHKQFFSDQFFGYCRLWDLWRKWGWLDYSNLWVRTHCVSLRSRFSGVGLVQTSRVVVVRCAQKLWCKVMTCLRVLYSISLVNKSTGSYMCCKKTSGGVGQYGAKVGSALSKSGGPHETWCKGKTCDVWSGEFHNFVMVVKVMCWEESVLCTGVGMDVQWDARRNKWQLHDSVGKFWHFDQLVILLVGKRKPQSCGNIAKC